MTPKASLLARIGRLLEYAYRRAVVSVRGPSYKAASYSQFGEDRILWNMLAAPSGFFVDVGAHHPQRFSNTYVFYTRGWNGLNIDPLPGVKAMFDKSRPRDITVECGISSEPGTLTYYAYDDPAWNTFDPAKRDTIKARGFPHLIGTHQIPLYPLARILDQHLPAGQTIDFFTIDVEGFDLAVLQSNDWTRYRPRFIVVEDGTMEGAVTDVQSSLLSPISTFISGLGYHMVGWTNGNAIWKDRPRPGANAR